jgi:hypothetical protein
MLLTPCNWTMGNDSISNQATLRGYCCGPVAIIGCPFWVQAV